MNSRNEFEYRIKIVIIGPVAVGKSSLLKVLCDESFTTEHVSTIGVDYGTISLEKEKKQYKFCLWDTSGNKSFLPITRSYFNGSVACLLLFDLNDPQTFQNAIEWYHKYRYKCPDNLVILIGSKVDKMYKTCSLYKNSPLTYGKIGEDSVRQFIEEYQLPYIEVSSLTGQNVSELKDLIINDINLKITTGKLKPNETVGLSIHKIEKGYAKPYKHNPKKKKPKEDIGCCTIS